MDCTATGVPDMGRKECSHVFIGTADGITCKICGLHMTVEEYREYLQPSGKTKNPAKPKQARKKAKTNE